MPKVDPEKPEAFQDGYSDYWLALSTNPFEFDSDDWHQWDAGWWTAYFEHEGAA